MVQEILKQITIYQIKHRVKQSYMQQIGKFILLNPHELGRYLNTVSVVRVIKLVQNHHTYIPNYSHFNGNNHFSLLQGMENAHLQRGFSEIAQNLTTFPDGTTAICRDMNKIPAGIMGANQYGICIENLGNFDVGGDSMADSQKATIVSLNATLCKKFKLTPSTDSIVYHHWYDLNSGQRTNGTGTTKSCPGTNFFGGNTVEAANDNFIPLITDQLKTIVQQSTSSAPSQHGTVNTPILNVRSGPGTNNSVLSQLTQGTVVAIYAELQGWYQIDAGQKWVSKDFIDLA